MSPNVVLHTNIKVTRAAKKGMGDLQPYDERKLRRTLKVLKHKSLFEVIQVFEDSSIREAFRKGAPVVHVMRSGIAVFSLRGSVLYLESVVTAIAKCVVNSLEFMLFREADLVRAFRQEMLRSFKPHDRYKRGLI